MKLKQLYYSLMMKISDYLEEIKRKKGTDKNTPLVLLLGVTRGYVADLVKGDKKISASKCLIIAEELNMKPELILVTMLYEKETDKKAKEKLKNIILRLEKAGN